MKFAVALALAVSAASAAYVPPAPEEPSYEKPTSVPAPESSYGQEPVPSSYVEEPIPTSAEEGPSYSMFLPPHKYLPRSC